ncbi:MAG: two-component system, NarL family, nitrate/nitrite response regulator NarL [Acidimicrobiaceae bacterium]
MVIIDDHKVFSRGLELLLNSEPSQRVEVKATSANAAEAAWLVERHRAAVALVDLQMPPPGGLAAIRAIKERSPETAVIALTGSEELESGLAALRAGVDGYIVKSADPEQLIPPILSVAAGMVVMPDWLRDRLVAEVERPRPDLSHLSTEELSILSMVCEGSDSAQIAQAIHVSERTAKRMLAALLRHMRVTNRIQAAILAAQAGLVGSSDAAD